MNREDEMAEKNSAMPGLLETKKGIGYKGGSVRFESGFIIQEQDSGFQGSTEALKRFPG